MNAQSSELNFPETYNLYMTSKNETMNSRIHEFKILQKRPASLLKPLYDDLLYPNYYFKNIFKPCFSILKAFKGILQHFKFVNCWLVVSFFDVTDRYILAKWLKFKVNESFSFSRSTTSVPSKSMDKDDAYCLRTEQRWPRSTNM